MVSCSSKQLIQYQLLVYTLTICLQSLGCVAIDVAILALRNENKIIMCDLDVQTLTLNLVVDFNRNFFIRTDDLFEKKKKNFFRIIEIKKIDRIFTIINSIKCPDHEQSSKNLLVSENRHSNHWISSVIQWCWKWGQVWKTQHFSPVQPAKK